ncbi:MAG: hypothetical protein P4L81_04990 [Candidatus Pacebacteria bacterium]|nr:hypothetical protein [Candidatus Paceibacterota bacterium]
MTKNPYLNALVAGLYVALVVLLISYGPTFVGAKSNGILVPMAMLSLLVFSAAFMGYLFFLQPALMYAEGQKREAVEFFSKTLVSFALLTGVIVLLAFLF